MNKRGPQADGQAVQRLDKPLAEVAEEFLRIKEATGRAPQTIKTYRYQLKYFYEYAGEGVKCSELTLDKLTGYLDHLRGRGITNPVTLNTAIQNLSPIIHSARERGYCPHNYLMRRSYAMEPIISRSAGNSHAVGRFYIELHDEWGSADFFRYRRGGAGCLLLFAKLYFHAHLGVDKRAVTHPVLALYGGHYAGWNNTVPADAPSADWAV